MKLEDEMKLLKEKVELLEKIKELQGVIDKHHTALSGKGGETMEEDKQYSWFLIMVSWDWEADKDALEKFDWVYRYITKGSGDPLADQAREALDFGKLWALNLIGKRKFVIVGRTKSNNVLQVISSKITLGTAIRVEVFPATYVHDFKGVKDVYERL